MITRIRSLTVAFGLFLLSVSLAPADKKVTICHLPPGNPANAQTLLVGEAAVGAHLGHGDAIGACLTGCQDAASRCDDSNACTSDTCDADGACVHAPVSCDDGNRCTRDRCDQATGCYAVADDGAACDDGNDCTGADACAGTTCAGTPIGGCCRTSADCGDANACSVDACVAGVCTNEPRDCSVPDQCLAGFCDAAGGCATAPVSCDDSDFCTDDGCDPATGCTHARTLTPPETIEISCADRFDNDCDGLADVADPDCFVCGDGVVQPGEECDGGNDNPADGCDLCRLDDDGED